MNIADKIVTFINGINLKSSINKKDKEDTNKQLKFLQPLVNNDNQKQKLEKIIDILNKGRLTEDDKIQLMSMKEKTTKIILQHENEFNILENIDITNDNLNNDQIEKILDDMIDKYTYLMVIILWIMFLLKKIKKDIAYQ